MDLQVKNMKVDISTNPRQNSLLGPYHHPQDRDKLLSPNTPPPQQLRGRKNYFKMSCFKSTFSKQVTEECTFCCNVLLMTLSKNLVAIMT